MAPAIDEADKRSERVDSRAPWVGRIEDEDVRDKRIDVRVSERQKALILELAAEDGMATSTWIMELILPELEKRRGYVEPRRAAPRRPNYRDRQAGGQK